MLVTYRLSVFTGMPMLHSIRHYYGKAASGLVGGALFLACMFFTIGNISGLGAGMHLLFGIDWKLGALIVMAFVLFCYFSKDVYSKVEKCAMIALCFMTVAFLIVLVKAGGAGLRSRFPGTDRVEISTGKPSDSHWFYWFQRRFNDRNLRNLSEQRKKVE